MNQQPYICQRDQITYRIWIKGARNAGEIREREELTKQPYSMKSFLINSVKENDVA